MSAFRFRLIQTSLVNCLQPFWHGYTHQLNINPLLTKCFTGFFGAILSDTLAQFLASGKNSNTPVPQGEYALSFKKSTSWNYDPMRTARMCIWAFLFGTPISHYWFLALDLAIMPGRPSSNLAALLKMLMDQTFMAPLGLALFLMALKSMEGEPGRAVEDMRSKIAPALLATWMVWPLANLINFRFIPQEQRILYCTIISIGHGTLLSHIQAQKPKLKSKEKDEAADQRCEMERGSRMKGFGGAATHG